MTFLPPTPAYHRGYDQAKWNYFPPDVLPLWVADTDFFVPPAVKDALHGLVDHGIFGYAMASPALSETILARLRERHAIEATAQDLVLLPNLVSALAISARMAGPKGTGILINSPIYPPFINVIRHEGQRMVDVPLARSVEGRVMRYEIDFDAVEAALTPDVRMWMFCNPHNPVGRSYTKAELERVADICLRHDLTLVSDEIHADLVYGGGTAVSLASISPEMAARTITLNAPSKTFNVPGIGFGFAVITQQELRSTFQTHAWMTGQHTSAFGMVGAQAAYESGQSYLDELLQYLQANRDAFVDYAEEHLPGVLYTVPEATFLVWMDWAAVGLPTKPHTFLLETAKVGLNNGTDFGELYDSFVRLNLGCSQETLFAALDRMRTALAVSAV